MDNSTTARDISNYPFNFQQFSSFLVSLSPSRIVIFIMMPFIISLVALCKLVTMELSTEQWAEAFGHFSSSKQPPVEIAKIDVWFGANAMPNIKQVILTSDDTTGILFYANGSFTVVSDMKWSLDATQQPSITGHLGDKLVSIAPIHIKHDDIFGEVYVLLPDSAESQNLNHLRATNNLATDVVTDDANVDHIFLENANLDVIPDLTNMCIAKFLALIPRPFGHSLDSTKAMDAEGMNTLSTKLNLLDPCLGSWLSSMYFSSKFFDGVSLQCDTLGIHDEYFKPLTNTNQLPLMIEV